MLFKPKSFFFFLAKGSKIYSNKTTTKKRWKMLMNIMKRKEKLKHVFFFQFEIHRYPLLLLQQTKLRKKNKRKYTNSVIFTNFRLSLTTIKMLNQQLCLPFSTKSFLLHIYIKWRNGKFGFLHFIIHHLYWWPSFLVLLLVLEIKRIHFSFLFPYIFLLKKKNFNLNCCNTQENMKSFSDFFFFGNA